MMPGLLALRGVSVGYRQRGRAGLILEDVSLDVAAEQTVAVVGQRREGKTTLLHLAAGMSLAEDGEVLFEGVDFASRSRRRREPAGLSQEALADACKLRRGAIARIEKAEREPRISTLVACSIALDVRLRVLLHGLPEGADATTP
jgi:ABC-type taurine transport system ATPase subunit